MQWLKKTAVTLGGSQLSSRGERDRPLSATILLSVWWLAFCVIASGFAFTTHRDVPMVLRLLLSPLLVAVVWLLAYTQRDAARAWVRDHIPGGYWRRWFLLAAPLTAVCVYSVIGFGMTLNLGPGVPVAFPLVLYALAIIGVLFIVWLLFRHCGVQPHHLFWTIGLGGSLAARGGVLPFAVLSGDLVGAALLLVYYVPIYGLGPAVACSFVPPGHDQKRLAPPARWRVISVTLLSFIVLALT